MIYKNCRELPIHNFNECELFGDLTYLVKDNEKHTELELSNKWSEIYFEYLELLGNEEVDRYYKDKLELYSYKLKVTQLENLVSLALLIHTLPNNEAYLIEFETLKRQLKANNIEIALSVARDKLNKKLIDFERIYKKNEKNKGIDAIIPILLKNNYRIDRHVTTVSEWCGLIKLLKHE